VREEVPGGVYHVFARGNDRGRIFRYDDDRRIYLALLRRTVRRQRWRCLSYCLMVNHVHLLVETPEPNLAVGMQRLHGAYAQTFNARHDRNGHLFQGRYGAVRIESDRQLWVAVRYVARNPVEAGLCTRPEHYAWSSHREIVARRPSPQVDRRRLLVYFEGAGGDPSRRYADFVRDA
jgi:REP element-mobilizing transposase RayT